MTAEPPAERSQLWRGLALGMAAAAFFSVSFVLNRKMAEADGHWAWTASLRYLMMLPLLAIIISMRRKWDELLAAWRSSPLGWVIWGTIGCGIFYATLAAAGALSPAWVVAGTWPVTIVIGIVIAPLLYQDHRRHIPRRALVNTLIILMGVILLQAGHAQAADLKSAVTGLILVLVSATAYPVGNRKSMILLERARLPADPYVRLTALTLGSLPAWLALGAWGYQSSGWPPTDQLVQSGIVAVSGGVIATALFFAATDTVGRDPSALAAVEATQAAEMLFTLLLEAIVIGIRPPDLLGWLGLAVIVCGIVLHAKPKRTKPMLS